MVHRMRLRIFFSTYNKQQQTDRDRNVQGKNSLCPNAVWTTAIRHGTERKDKRRQFTVAMDLIIQ